MQLCTEIEQLRSLVDAQQIRIAHVTKENQRLNLLMGHLMPRDVGPTTNYRSTDADSNEGNGETAETEKSEVVQRLETIVELSDSSSNTSKSE
ncbi:hypothetical protein FOMA001_g9772 [Fusarium oxysporum f. sp. matthiolae]|nr:hypothetical protein FOMA001_g9772 [Fusarium oxysporum f. sp. matthiolae]